MAAAAVAFENHAASSGQGGENMSPLVFHVGVNPKTNEQQLQARSEFEGQKVLFVPDKSSVIPEPGKQYRSLRFGRWLSPTVGTVIIDEAPVAEPVPIVAKTVSAPAKKVDVVGPEPRYGMPGPSPAMPLRSGCCATVAAQLQAAFNTRPGLKVGEREISRPKVRQVVGEVALANCQGNLRGE